MKFVIAGAIVPYTRVTRGSLWTPRAQRYYKSQGRIADQIRQQMLINRWLILPAKTPLTVSLELAVSSRIHGKDLDNMTKAVLDAAQGVALVDDRWVDAIFATRHKAGEDSTIFDITLLDASF